MIEKLTQMGMTLSEKQKDHMRAFADSCKENNYSKKSGFFKRIFDKK